MANVAPGFVPGIVTHNDDPEAGGRVRVMVPGLIEPYSTFWALPACWPGAVGIGEGSQYKPPKVGSHVFVIFEYGVYDSPNTRAMYLTGYYGLDTDGTIASPNSIASATTVAAALQRTCLYEDQSIAVFEVDEPTVKKFVVMAKKSGSKIELNAADGEMGTSETIYVEARTMISLYCKGAIEIKGNPVIINGRLVGLKGDI